MQDFKLLTLLCLSSFLACKINTQNNREHFPSKDYDSEWVQGRRLFLDNCTYCHLGIMKDEIFKDYILSINKLRQDKKVKNLSSIIADSQHTDIQYVKLTQQQIKAIVKYLEVPQKSGIVD